MSFFSEFVPIMLAIIAMAFVLKFIDNTIGIGFGTVFTPILILLGISTITIVPSILFTEVIAGIVGIIFHSLLRNVKLGQKRIFRKQKQSIREVHILPEFDLATSSPKTKVKKRILAIELKEEDELIIEDERDIELADDEEIEQVVIEHENIWERIKHLTTDTKVIFILIGFGLIGAIISPILSVVFDDNVNFLFGMEIYIGLMVFVMGIIAIVLRNKELTVNFKKIIALGFIGGFNKGISGGGYTPITVVGQMLAGREGKNALASTIFSKTAVSFVGGLSYILAHIIESQSIGMAITWEYLELAPYLIIGAIFAAPLAAFVTKISENKWIKITVGYATIFLGLFSLLHSILVFTDVWEQTSLFL